MAQVERCFASVGEVITLPGRTISPADLENIDVLLVRSVTRVDADLLAGSGVKFVGTATSGFDHIDRGYLQSRDIGFAHAPGSNANSVVEYVLSVICSDASRLEQLLAGQPVGIIGYGQVGQALHARLQALGINCRACDPWLDQGRYADLAALPEVLGCPVVCVHAALTDQAPWPSRHLLNASNLRQLSPGALLINAGRGPIVDNSALSRLLECRDDLHIALDVWEFEPQVDLKLMRQCRWATPHIAGYSYDGKLRAAAMLKRAICEFFEMSHADGDGADAAPGLTVPTSLQGADLIRWLQAKTYRVQEDDQRMRLELERGFDRLRAQYPQRRELSSFTVANAAALDATAVAICAAMDLRLD